MTDIRTLRLLAAVATHNATGTTLVARSGLTPAEFERANNAAQERDLVKITGKLHPALVLTEIGREWAAEELAPYAHLIAATTQTEVAQ